ncbi:hypothetical protein T8K17_05135 [Thalassobaculum sp. OXR-137]|uniref:hypothetical protein n=1 Tax=Thalassobaculum sp. OXR-137 TaxID=3100173 RepID=UPI002AC9B535|nr:hypothetical protein [Thalassobaculum sp. OXR-137]WPZ35530.1 hypothetical protein T8K17_05135 [Thalassobaculum sp. OXR-137]
MTALPICIVSAGFANRNQSWRRRGSILSAMDDVLPPDEWQMAQRDIPAYDVHRADEIIAARLILGGIDPAEVFYEDDPLVGETVVAMDGSGLRRVREGGRLRRWQGFPSQSLARKKEQARQYGAFTRVTGINRTEQVRLTPPRHQIPLREIRAAHSSTSRDLNNLVRLAVRKSSVVVDMVSAHFAKDAQATGTAYQHFHLVARTAADDLDDFKSVFIENGWDIWTAVDNEETDHSIYGLPQYLSGGLAATASDDWTHAELAEIYRQTKGLALCRAVGEFRRFLHELNACDQVVDRNGDIRARWHRGNPVRRPDWLFRSAGFRALFVTEWDYGDGVKRPAIVVSGRTGVSAREIESVYDLRNNTAIPKHVHDQQRPEDPPPEPTPMESEDEQVPF